MGLGPTAHTTAVISSYLQLQQESSLPPVTSVEINEAESMLSAQAAADDGELHEPAGQVRIVLKFRSFAAVLC